ncbi:MAG: hypothetical protein GKR89_02975 [Candidatus Latescibacteria bacterium]|nr:hypothetical protein [Candidatus Latescibacterota bacterium]
MSTTYRVGLIGCGRMGATIDDEVKDRPNSHLYLPYSHAAAAVACQRTELVAVCDPIEEKAQSIQQRYGAERAYTDHEEMIRQEGLDIVCIATRPSPHLGTVVFAAENGVKGIYCEKPLCNSMREADAMLAACRDHNVKFNYGTQRRYTGMYRQMRQLIDEGAIGEINAVMAHVGVGAAQWGHTHGADMLLYLAGDGPIDFVQGHAVIDDDQWEGDRLTVDPGIAMGYAHFQNGVHGYLLASTGYEFEISGSKGKLRTLSNGSGYTWRALGDHGDYVDTQGPEAIIESGTLRALEDLAGALDDNGQTQGPIELACRSQEMVLGFVASQRQGGARVELPLANRDMAIAPDNY